MTPEQKPWPQYVKGAFHLSPLCPQLSLILLFVYLCICVFLYLCIYVFASIICVHQAMCTNICGINDPRTISQEGFLSASVFPSALLASIFCVFVYLRICAFLTPEQYSIRLSFALSSPSMLPSSAQRISNSPQNLLIHQDER